MYVILFLVSCIIFSSVSIIYIILRLISFSRSTVMKINFVGEVLVFLSVVLAFIVNTNILGSYKSDDLITQEILKDIDIRVDKLKRNIALEHTDDETAIERIHELENQVKYSDKQVTTANTISGSIAFLGALLLFIGEIGKMKVEKTHRNV